MASFIGYCRDEGVLLAALELEHYPGMAEDEIARAAGEAEARWPLLGATVIHRYGRIVPGERIVLVAVAAEHRGPAFAAAPAPVSGNTHVVAPGETIYSLARHYRLSPAAIAKANNLSLAHQLSIGQLSEKVLQHMRESRLFIVCRYDDGYGNFARKFHIDALVKRSTGYLHLLFWYL